MNSFIENEDIESRYGEEIYEDFTNYQKLQERINKALHYIQLLQMDGEVTIRDLTELVNVLKGE